VVAVAASGCGGSRPPVATTTALTLPRRLAQVWASRADAIAAAAAAGRGCQARTLADSLRDEVVSAGARVPAAFRTTLLASVSQLADRITCTPQSAAGTTPATSHQQKPPKGHGHHGKPPKHRGGEGGDQQ
jgi:hypothetical protein